MKSLKFPRLRKKIDAFRVESGVNSIANQVSRRGLSLLVIDKWGQSYEVQKWFESETFWCGLQKNLLIKDNQTIKYDNASEDIKKHYTNLAWGK